MLRLAGVAIQAAFVAAGMAYVRGPVWGLVVFIFVGLMFGIGAVSMSWVRRWSAKHVVADSLFIVPFIFLGLLIIPVLPWWAAALIALAAGSVLVPFMVRRRRIAEGRAASPAGNESRVWFGGFE
ncbi:hypothetical protein GCM10010170_072290 [Dactylosporangium salmoneum]|uniref:Integral membrane protein n=1 Tax=Dactylosporangium salmoneum TaxID=53361 RepID=A0ABP5UA71_9ACTN